MTQIFSSRGYVDTLAFLGDVGSPMFDPKTLDNAGKSGVTLFHLTSTLPFQDWEASLNNHVHVLEQLERHGDIFAVIQSSSDLKFIQDSGKIGVIMGVQDPEFISNRLDRLEDLFDRNIRIMQVAYQRANPYGAGFLAEDQDRGLTPLGREFVTEVHRAGMILDLSHLSSRTALECLQIAKGPVMVSHTTARNIYHHPRGCPDEVFRALARRKDTIVGVLAMTFFLDSLNNSLTPLLQHIRHIADIVGSERVAVGSDGPMGGFTDIEAAERAFREIMQARMDPEGLLGSRWPSHIPDFTNTIDGFGQLGKALSGRFDPEEISGILGENGYRWFSRALPGGDLWEQGT